VGKRSAPPLSLPVRTHGSGRLTRCLPVRPNLDQLKLHAKDFLRGIRCGDPASIEDSKYHPRFTGIALHAQEASPERESEQPRMHLSTSAGGAAEGSQGRARFAPPLAHAPHQGPSPERAIERITKRIARHIQLRSALTVQGTLPNLCNRWMNHFQPAAERVRSSFGKPSVSMTRPACPMCRRSCATRIL
jgi:hypothetical protein